MTPPREVWVVVRADARPVSVQRSESDAADVSWPGETVTRYTLPQSLLTAADAQRLRDALAIEVQGDDLPSCDPAFDFVAWMTRSDAIDMAVGAMIGTREGARPTVHDLARWLLAQDDRIRGTG